jgi:hypothetical protein
MRVLRKTAVLLLLGALLAVPAVSAAGARPAPPSESKSSLRVALTFLETVGTLFAREWSKTGCKIDPLGACVNDGTSVPSGDNGCSIDPWGQCGASTTESDLGCSIDPWGHCATGP